MLSTLLSKEPNSTDVLANSLKLENQILAERLNAERAMTQRNEIDLLPHRLYGVSLTNDGLQWIAKLEVSEGVLVVGSGECPSQALMDFDKQWLGTK